MPQALDAYARPPEPLRNLYKRFHNLPLAALDADESVFDVERGRLAGFAESHHPRRDVGLPDDLREVIGTFLQSDKSTTTLSTPRAYEHPDVPGLYIFPSLLPPPVQLRLLDTLLHRDLSNEAHKTNIHMHYNVPYPPDASGQPHSFFSSETSALQFLPRDPAIHRPLSTKQFLNRKLRWMTLGGQYDWTRKVYPSTTPPPFPHDVAALIQGLFPAMKAQAAIVNLYSPGDTLSLHRDVSEECDRPLASLSLGCDAIFVVGLDGGERAATMRLRSGDAVVMSGEARFAWHSVPQILAGTCPTWMADWPCVDPMQTEYEHCKGWMAGKRINVNVRQMWD